MDKVEPSSSFVLGTLDEFGTRIIPTALDQALVSYKGFFDKAKLDEVHLL